MAAPYQNTIFLNLPVADLSRSIAFYKALGFVQNVAFSDANGVMMSLPATPTAPATAAHDGPIKLMLLAHSFYQTFLPEGVTMADPAKTAQMLICFSRESKAGVDEFLELVAKSGGKRDIRPKSEMDKTMEGGGMYGGNAMDPDGHILEVMYMPTNTQDPPKESA